MATWINFCSLAAPRISGSYTHTVGPDGTGGAVFAGTAFTPTEGNLLLCVANGAVTFSTPSGWTLPSNGSAIYYTGLYVFGRTATAGSNNFTTTHNGANYPANFTFLEFYQGSSFVKSAYSDNESPNTPNPALTGLLAGDTTFGVAGINASETDHTEGNGYFVVWNTGTRLFTKTVPKLGTDGYMHSVVATDHIEGTSAPSYSYSGSKTDFMSNGQRLTFAIRAVAPPAAPGKNLYRRSSGLLVPATFRKRSGGVLV